MELSDRRNKEKIAIVVVGYNRINSIKRLLCSLLTANYSSEDIPLIISIDASGDKELYDYVQLFEWPHGDLYINIQHEKLGLKRHIIQCGDLTKYFRAIILLEDDIFVSEYFYGYVKCAVNYYYNEERIAGISLINSEMGYPGLPMSYLQNGSDSFLKQFPASWGECWTEKQWTEFRKWYDNFSDEQFNELDIPDRVKGWKQAWSKYFVAYMYTTGRYFVYPYISHTTCFGDAGVHASSVSSISQTNLIAGPKEYSFKPFDELVKYDTFGINENIYQWVGYNKDELCVDWYCQNRNIKKRRYILTTAKLPHKIIKTYGLQLRPIELNIKYNLEGGDLFLYDTLNGEDSANNYTLPLSVAFYHLRSFNIKLAKQYVMYYYKQRILKKISNIGL